MAQNSKGNEQNNCIPKANVGDEAFFSDEFNESYKFHGIKGLPCGPRTPWPNRAETAARLFKRQWSIMTTSWEGDDGFNGVTIRQAVKMTVWARNAELTISGYSPWGVAAGRLPPDLFDVEAANPEQLFSDPPEEDLSTLALQRDEVFYWHQDSNKFNDKGKWIRGKVLSQEGATAHIHTDKEW